MEKLKTLSKEDLEKQLLIEDIKLKQHSSGIFGKIANVIALFSSVGALIAAIVALFIAKSDQSKKIIEANEAKVILLKTKQKINDLNTRLEDQLQKEEKLNIDISKLQKYRQNLELELKAMEDATTIHQNIYGLNIDIRVKNDHNYFNISTYPTKAKLSIYFNCNENFTFPNNNPQLEKCEKTENITCITSPCSFGPISKMGNLKNDFWVIADFGNHKETRYINLSTF